jgi:hypothetical protein
VNGPCSVWTEFVQISRAIPRGSASAHTVAAISATAQRCCREGVARNSRRSNSATIARGPRGPIN